MLINAFMCQPNVDTVKLQLKAFLIFVAEDNEWGRASWVNGCDCIRNSILCKSYYVNHNMIIMIYIINLNYVNHCTIIVIYYQLIMSIFVC